MSVNVVMPKLGESVTEGTVVRWLKQIGDSIERDEPILEITTDKIDTDVPSIAAGILQEILVQEGQTVEVGQVLGIIDSGDEVPADTPPPEEVKAAENDAVTTPSDGATTIVPHAEKSPRGRFYSPLVKSIAKQEGIALQELDTLNGSGRNGRVTKKDILAHIANRSARTIDTSIPAGPALVYSADEANVSTMDGIRKAIAEHMVRSKRTSPHVTSFSEIDMTHLVQYREQVKEAFLQKEGFKLTLTPFFIAAIVEALRENPLLNASVDGDNIVMWKHINFGLAVGLEKGVIVPVIPHAEEKNFIGLARAANDLAVRARNRKLNPDELQGGTFTLTNPGMFGTIMGTPIINQPQVGIIATGAVKKRVVVLENDTMGIRSMMYMSLSYDHRVIDGLNGAKFTQDITRKLEQFDLSEVGL